MVLEILKFLLGVHGCFSPGDCTRSTNFTRW